MKKLLKVLVTIMLAVAFVLPTAIVVHADDTVFYELTSKGSPITVNSNNRNVIFTGSSLPFTFSELKSSLKQESNSVCRIAAYSSGKLLDDADALKTGDKIKIEQIDNSGDTPVYTTLYKDGIECTYTMIIRGDVNMDGYVDINDKQYAVEYTRGNEIVKYPESLPKNNSVAIVLNGDSTIMPDAESYDLAISFRANSLETSVSYIEFILTVPSFLTYSDYSIPSDMSGWDPPTCESVGTNQLKLSAYKTDFNGAVFDSSATTAKKMIYLSFTLKNGTAAGSTESFTVSQAKGVSNIGGSFAAMAGTGKSVAVGSTVPTAPTLNTKNEASITLNSVIGYQYYCSTSNEVPASDSEYWIQAAAQTITFSALSPGTTYYIYYRRTADDTAYLMEGSIKTDDPAAIRGPRVESSDTTSITVAFGEDFEGIYFSNNSMEPGLNSSWITRESRGGAISGIGSYTVDKIAETVTFSGLSSGKYFITGKKASGAISEQTVWAPTPNITENKVTANANSIELPYAYMYSYSIDGRNFYGASVKSNMTAGGTIYIQRETINGNPNVAVIHGLENNKEYTVYIQAYEGNNPISAVCTLTVTTGTATPTKPPELAVQGRSQIYIAVTYNKSLNYRINNSAWTASFATSTSFPTETNMVTLGDFAYYFNNSTNPTAIFFTKLKQDTSYKIDAKLVDDAANTTNISSVTTKTLVCTHVYGEKKYVGNTLKYTQTCTICGDVKSGEDTPVHVHTYETITVPSTCVTHGYTYQKCSGCNAVLDGSRVELPLVPHTETTRGKTHATCTAYGTVDVVCSVCGAVIRENEINANDPPKGHQYETITDYKAPTCTVAGHEKIYQKCSVCGDESLVSERDIAALGHDATWVVTVEPTATTEGRKDYICARCGDVLDTEVIAKLISYIKNTNGTGTYEIEVNENKALVSDAAKLAIADGDASVKVVFPGGVSVELDPAMTVAFLLEGPVFPCYRKSARCISSSLCASYHDRTWQ